MAHAAEKRIIFHCFGSCYLRSATSMSMCHTNIYWFLLYFSHSSNCTLEYGLCVALDVCAFILPNGRRCWQLKTHEKKYYEYKQTRKTSMPTMTKNDETSSAAVYHIITTIRVRCERATERKRGGWKINCIVWIFCFGRPRNVDGSQCQQQQQKHHN